MFEGSAKGARRRLPQPPKAGLSGAFGRNVARYRSASDSPKLIASVSGVRPSNDRDSVMLARVGVRYFDTGSSGGGSGARDAILVLTTGRNAGGDARRGGEGATFQVSAEAGGVPGEGPGTADCYGHCW